MQNLTKEQTTLQNLLSVSENATSPSENMEKEVSSAIEK